MGRNALLPKRLVLVFLSFFAIGYGQTTNNISGKWVENNPGGTGCPALALYPDNRPTIFALTQVAVPQSTIDFSLYVLQQNVQDASTNEWKDDFPIYNLNQRELVSDISLSFDAQNNASFAAWVESKYQYNEPSIVVGKRGSAAASQHIFQVDPSKDGFAISSSLDNQGNPIVAWSEGFTETTNSTGDIAIDYLQLSHYPKRKKDFSETMTYIQQWDGNDWLETGTPLEGHNPTLVLNSQDTPYLSYFNTSDEAVVVYWDGEIWQQLGDSISSPVDPFEDISLILDNEGMPIIAFIGLSESKQPKLFVKWWNGTAWQSLGEDSVVVTGHNPLDVSLDYRDGKLALATIEAEPQQFDFEPPQILYVKEWNGESWQLLGDDPISSGAACPVIQLDSQGNPYVAWSQIFSDGHTAHTTVKLSHFVRE